MIKYFFWCLGLVKRYEVIYHNLITSCKLDSIIYYDYSFLPDWMIKDRFLTWSKDRVQTCIQSVIYIERIGNTIYKQQMVR